jgi:hypothetical protein
MDHVVPVSLIGETGLFVAANRKAKKLLRGNGGHNW